MTRFCCLALLLARSIHAQHAPPESAKPYFSSEQDRVRRPGAAPPFVFDASTTYTLSALIDIAESRNPETKEAWQAARAQAAAVGIARSELYPILRAFLMGYTNQNGVLLYNEFALQDLGLGEAGLSLEYTIVDFGARLDRIHQTA